jgi:hypothetical protein
LDERRIDNYRSVHAFAEDLFSEEQSLEALVQNIQEHGG